MGAPGTDLRGWRWLRGRARRAEFWLWTTVLVAWTALLSFAPDNIVHLIAPYVLLLQAVRRLHDFGRSGWWVVGLILGPMTVYAGATAYMLPVQAGSLATLFLLCAHVVLGLIPGDRGENRFGPAHERPLKETFG